MAHVKLNGALQWSAAEEAASRISAVRSRIGTAADGEGAVLRNGLHELDAIQAFIEDGITRCNRQFLDGGSRDVMLRNSLERGLADLEEVRAALMGRLVKDEQTASKKRPPSASKARESIAFRMNPRPYMRPTSALPRKKLADDANAAAAPPSDTTAPAHNPVTPPNPTFTRVENPYATLKGRAARPSSAPMSRQAPPQNSTEAPSEERPALRANHWITGLNRGASKDGDTPLRGPGGSAFRRLSGDKDRALGAHAQSLREQGNVMFQKKRYREAADCYSKALELEPNSDTLLCNRAAAFLMLNRFNEALSDSRRVMDADPHHLKATWRTAKALLYLGRSEEARRAYASALALSKVPSETESIETEMRAVEVAERCRRALRMKEWTEAIRTADQLLETFPPGNPSSTLWQCLRAEAQLQVDPQEALNYLSHMCTEDPTCAEAWYLRGKSIFYSAHDAASTTSAIGFLQRAREIDGSIMKFVVLQSTVESFTRLRDEGNAAYSTGRWSDAYAAYTKCLSLDSQNTKLKAISLCNRAAVCIQCERWKDALDDISGSITLNSTNAKAYSRRARIHQHYHHHDAAVKDLQTAVHLYPSSENQEKLQQAIEHQQAAIRQQQQQHHQQHQQQNQNSQQTRFSFQSGGSRAQRPNTAGPRRTASAAAAVMRVAPTRTYYDTLGVARHADDRAVTKAYREAALRWHPDKWTTGTPEEQRTAEATFKEISTAYSVLKDAAKRRQYDLTI